MKLRYVFEKMQLDDKYVAVPVGQGAYEFHSAIRLNDTAAEIFDLLQEDITEEEIISIMKQRYSNDENVGEYVHEFIEKLFKEHVIE